MREIFIPRTRIPAYQSDIDRYRDLYSGKKDLYLSVYEYKGIGTQAIKPQNAIIDKIFLDFDYDEDMQFFEDTKTVANFLYDIGAKFKIRFSGRGFHLFIYLTDTQLKNPKKAIRSWVKDIHEKTNTISDPSVVGDIRRVSRMIGTMNMKTHLYCIPLDYAHLMNFTYEAICEEAKTWKPVYHLNDKLSGLEEWIIEGALVDISSYDSEEEIIKSTPIDVSKIKIQDGYPPCIEKMLANPNLGYRERGQLIIFLRDQGYSFYEILSILKSILSEKKYIHSTEEENQPEYLYYIREDLLFGNCDTQKENGICPYNGYCGGPYLYL